jgi:homoserine kinase type II
MAVFTTVSPAQAAHWLEGFALGHLLGLEGIASGIENSNFFLDAEGGRFVLTLFERLSAQDLPFYLGLMKHLAQRGIVCPDPVADRGGRLFSPLCGKPAALVTRLAGRPCMTPTVTHCSAIGALLARMHRAGEDYPLQLPNPRGRSWWPAAAADLRSHLAPAARELLEDELEAQQAFSDSGDFARLPGGAVHADLFRDNVLFDTSASPHAPPAAGVIDFYFACTDHWLFDLAVTANDWCIDDATGRWAEDRLDALLAAYRQVRPPCAAEARAWPMMLRAAALRFWLSRLHDYHLPRPAEMVKAKDPTHFERILANRRNRPQLLLD